MSGPNSSADFFEEKYRSREDPWVIGDMQANDYYLRLLAILKRLGPSFDRALDLGCGEGQFTRMLGEISGHAHGVDISPTAISRAVERFGGEDGLSFETCDITAQALAGVPDGQSFNLILCSEVLYYYDPSVVAPTLETLAGFLAADGHLFIINNDQGSRYSLSEMIAFVSRSFSVLESGRLDGHYFIVAGEKRPYLSVTLDYEPLETEYGYARDKALDIHTQLIAPTNRIMSIAEELGVRLTFFVEMGQLQYWDKFGPHISGPMRQQILDAYSRGHDVQLHLHPRWLPESGARYDEGKDRNVWAMDKGTLARLTEEELKQALTRATEVLRDLIRPLDPTYSPTLFRAGAYQIQPHEAVFRVLRNLGFKADSSVMPGAFKALKEGLSGIDFRHAWTTDQPYWPLADDICLPGESGDGLLLEMPVSAVNGVPLSIDPIHLPSFAGLSTKFDGQHLVCIGHPKDFDGNEKPLRQALGDVAGKFAFAGMRYSAAAYFASAKSEQSDHAADMSYYSRVLPSLEQLRHQLTDLHTGKISKISEMIRDRLETHGSVSLLDDGCGTGELFTVHLANNFKDDDRVSVTGFDVDKASILRLRGHIEKSAISGLDATADASDITRKSYDIVCCLEVLEHLDEPVTLVEEIAAAMAPDGLAYITVPNGYGQSEIEAQVYNFLRPRLIKFKSFMKVALWIKKKLNSNQGGEESSTAPIAETLHVSNNVHVQFYRFKDVPRMFEDAGLELVEHGNTVILSGLMGMAANRFSLTRRLNLKLRGYFPRVLASGWWYVFRKRPDA